MSAACSFEADEQLALPEDSPSTLFAREGHTLDMLRAAVMAGSKEEQGEAGTCTLLAQARKGASKIRTASSPEPPAISQPGPSFLAGF
jgi:hypothetical protein